jgi:hypothetical protein
MKYVPVCPFCSVPENVTRLPPEVLGFSTGIIWDPEAATANEYCGNDDE